MFLFHIAWERSELVRYRVHSGGVIRVRIGDPRSLGSWYIKGTDETALVTDSSASLTHQDHSDHGTSKEPMKPLWSRIHRRHWRTMIQVILDHWSWSRSPQKNARIALNVTCNTIREISYLQALVYHLCLLYCGVHKDCERQNSRIWLAEIDIDRGLDLPI